MIEDLRDQAKPEGSRIFLTDAPSGGGLNTLHKIGDPQAYSKSAGSNAQVPDEELEHLGPVLKRFNDPSYQQERGRRGKLGEGEIVKKIRGK